MIKRNDGYNKEIRVNMRGGDGQVLITKLFEKEELFGKSRMFSILTLEPGCGVGMHEHVGEQEYFYVLKGEPLYFDDDKEVQLHEGDATICEDGHSHGLVNRTNETVTMLALIL